MNELVKIGSSEINGIETQTVNARELWYFLESKQDFSDWIKNRIEKYGFQEGTDYLLHKFMEQHPSGAKQKTDYITTLDMAKELAMVENNERGRQPRRVRKFKMRKLFRRIWDWVMEKERMLYGREEGKGDRGSGSKYEERRTLRRPICRSEYVPEIKRKYQPIETLRKA